MFLLDYFRLRRVVERHHREQLAAIKALHEELWSMKVLLQIINTRINK